MGKTIALVLSGESLKGRKLGKEIDSADIVVKLHNAEWQNNKDHGARWDYSVVPSPWGNTAIAQIKRIPEEGFVFYRLPHQKNKKPDPSILQEKECFSLESMLAHDFFTEKVVPTRGLAAIELCFHILGASKVIVYGADSLKKGKITTFYDGKPNDNSARHDFKLESKVIHDIWNKKVRFRP